MRVQLTTLQNKLPPLRAEKNNRNHISDWQNSPPNHDTASRGSHQPWHCSEGPKERVSDNFLGVSSKCLRWPVIQSILRKRGKEQATSFPGFSFIWDVVLFEGFMKHSKLNCWDKYCLVKVAPFQWQLPIPWLSSLQQKDWVRSNVDTTCMPKI